MIEGKSRHFRYDQHIKSFNLWTGSFFGDTPARVGEAHSRNILVWSTCKQGISNQTRAPNPKYVAAKVKFYSWYKEKATVQLLLVENDLWCECSMICESNRLRWNNRRFSLMGHDHVTPPLQGASWHLAGHKLNPPLWFDVITEKFTSLRDILIIFQKQTKFDWHWKSDVSPCKLSWPHNRTDNPKSALGCPWSKL